MVIADGITLWAVHVVEHDTALSRDELWEELSAGPDRRVFLTEGEARAAAEAEVLAEWTETRADDPECMPERPPSDWVPVAEGDAPWALESPEGPRGSKLCVDWLGRTWCVLALRVTRPTE